MQYVFMDMTTFEEIRVPQDPSWSVYIVEGCQVTLVLWNDAVGMLDFSRNRFDSGIC